MVSVGQDGGAVFTAVLPGCLAPEDPPDVTGRESGLVGPLPLDGPTPTAADRLPAAPAGWVSAAAGDKVPAGVPRPRVVS